MPVISRGLLSGPRSPSFLPCGPHRPLTTWQLDSKPVEDCLLILLRQSLTGSSNRSCIYPTAFTMELNLIRELVLSPLPHCIVRSKSRVLPALTDGDCMQVWLDGGHLRACPSCSAAFDQLWDAELSLPPTHAPAQPPALCSLPTNSRAPHTRPWFMVCFAGP